MKLLKKLEKRSWKLPNSKNKTATFGLFECEICNDTKETSLTHGNSAKTCGRKECIQKLRKLNQSKIFNSTINRDGNYKKSPFYRTFTRMYDGIKQRCYNTKHKSYKYYGERGIEVSKEWLNFETFAEDMFKEYEQLKNNSKELKTSPSIDRIDKNKNYSKKNCKWIPYGENSAKDKRIPINQTDFDGNIIATFESATSAEKIIKTVKFGLLDIQVNRTQILDNCNGKSSHHVGYNWEFATDKVTLQ